MTWHTFKEIDRDAAQSSDRLRHRPEYMRAALGLANITGDETPGEMSLE
jgi:hypothetical protein